MESQPLVVDQPLVEDFEMEGAVAVEEHFDWLERAASAYAPLYRAVFWLVPRILTFGVST